MWPQQELKGNTTVQTNMEQMTKEFNIACAKAVRDTIHKLAVKWDQELIDTLNANDFQITVELYNGDLCIEAYIGKDDFFGPIRYENEEMNSLVQEAFDELPLQVVLNALIYDGLESVSQITQWRIK